MSANSKGSGETVLMRRLARAIAGRLCDKYRFLLRWLKLLLKILPQEEAFTVT